MSQSPRSNINSFSVTTSLFALVSCLAGVTILVFPTREDVHHLIETTVAPLAREVHEHTALPTHPAQQRWSNMLETRLFALDQRLEQLEIHLAHLQATVQVHSQRKEP